MSRYPDALDSADAQTVVECVESEYDCEIVKSDEKSNGLYLTIRSGKKNSMPSRLLRNLRTADFTVITIHNIPRDGEYQLEATFGPGQGARR